VRVETQQQMTLWVRGCWEQQFFGDAAQGLGLGAGDVNEVRRFATGVAGPTWDIVVCIAGVTGTGVFEPARKTSGIQWTRIGNSGQVDIFNVGSRSGWGICTLAQLNCLGVPL
jgi:hypothetical protein